MWRGRVWRERDRQERKGGWRGRGRLSLLVLGI